MSDEILDDLFYSLREPAWHKKGKVSQKELNAKDSYKVMGEVPVRLRPLYTDDNVQAPAFAIWRDPTTKTKTHEFFGIVSPDYQLITPAEICELYDIHVGKPVETMAALYRGRVFMLSTKLPSYDVKGDLLDDYLLIYNYMTGLGACHVKNTAVRVKCANTLRAAIRGKGESHRIVHRADAKKQLAHWMEDLYERGVQTAATLKELFNILAATRVPDSEALTLTKKIYPIPQGLDVPESVVVHARATQNTVMALFQGAGRGADTPAFKGSAWGWYNSVVEYEDHVRKAGPNVIESVLIGPRALVKEKAFDAALSFSKN